MAQDATAEVFRLVNQVRVANGVAPLKRAWELDAAAKLHAVFMATRGMLSHTGAGGSGPGDRMSAVGYDWVLWGENIAEGYDSAAAVMAGWMSSPGHRANILNPRFREIGIAVVDLPFSRARYYWTQDFGTRDGDTSPTTDQRPTTNEPPGSGTGAPAALPGAGAPLTAPVTPATSSDPPALGTIPAPTATNPPAPPAAGPATSPVTVPAAIPATPTRTTPPLPATTPTTPAPSLPEPPVPTPSVPTPVFPTPTGPSPGGIPAPSAPAPASTPSSTDPVSSPSATTPASPPAPSGPAPGVPAPAVPAPTVPGPSTPAPSTVMPPSVPTLPAPAVPAPSGTTTPPTPSAPAVPPAVETPAPLKDPVLDEFSPASGPPGTELTLTGENLMVPGGTIRLMLRSSRNGSVYGTATILEGTLTPTSVRVRLYPASGVGFTKGTYYVWLRRYQGDTPTGSYRYSNTRMFTFR